MSLRPVAIAALASLLAAPARAFELHSSAFAAGADIPAAHTCDGADRSPPLAWTDPPADAKSFALVCEDPDAPARMWVHWVVYDLPATAREMPEGVPTTPTLAGGARQGINDFKRSGWAGPCPPHGGPHRYVFRLYALDAPPGLGTGATRDGLVTAMTGHTRGHAELVGRYERK